MMKLRSTHMLLLCLALSAAAALGGDAYVLLESIYAGDEGLGLLKLDAA